MTNYETLETIHTLNAAGMQTSRIQEHMLQAIYDLPNEGAWAVPAPTTVNTDMIAALEKQLGQRNQAIHELITVIRQNKNDRWPRLSNDDWLDVDKAEMLANEPMPFKTEVLAPANSPRRLAQRQSGPLQGPEDAFDSRDVDSRSGWSMSVSLPGVHSQGEVTMKRFCWSWR